LIGLKQVARLDLSRGTFSWTREGGAQLDLSSGYSLLDSRGLSVLTPGGLVQQHRCGFQEEKIRLQTWQAQSCSNNIIPKALMMKVEATGLSSRDALSWTQGSVAALV